MSSGALGACVLGLVLLTASGCGPSFQVVYEGDVQFEHCYGLDMGTASTDAKRSCWRTWVASYTYGQARDRIDYAALRLNELASSTTSEDAPAALGPVRALPAVASPMPKDAFVPPPNVSDGRGDGALLGDAGAPTIAVHVSAARAPGAECADACRERWTSCYGSCRDVSCGSCDRAYRACMPLCFGEDGTSAHASPRRTR